jgi:hypothetical protein
MRGSSLFLMLAIAACNSVASAPPSPSSEPGPPLPPPPPAVATASASASASASAPVATEPPPTTTLDQLRKFKPPMPKEYATSYDWWEAPISYNEAIYWKLRSKKDPTKQPLSVSISNETKAVKSGSQTKFTDKKFRALEAKRGKYMLAIHDGNMLVQVDTKTPGEDGYAADIAKDTVVEKIIGTLDLDGIGKL